MLREQQAQKEDSGPRTCSSIARDPGSVKLKVQDDKWGES